MAPVTISIPFTTFSRQNRVMLFPVPVERRGTVSPAGQQVENRFMKHQLGLFTDDLNRKKDWAGNRWKVRVRQSVVG